MLALALLRVLFSHWRDLGKSDRAQARKSILQSKGMVHSMSREERQHLNRLARQVHGKKLAYDLAAAAAPFPTPKLFKKSKKKK
jgi:hypothetical protein